MSTLIWFAWNKFEKKKCNKSCGRNFETKKKKWASNQQSMNPSKPVLEVKYFLTLFTISTKSIVFLLRNPSKLLMSERMYIDISSFNSDLSFLFYSPFRMPRVQYSSN